MGAIFELFPMMHCPSLTVKTRPGCAKNRKTVKNVQFWLSAGPVRVELRMDDPHCGWILRFSEVSEVG